MLKKIFSTLKSYNYHCINFRLIFYVLTLSILGVVSIGSAEGDFYLKRQAIGLIVGTILMIIIMLINYKFIFKFYWPLYILTIVLLLAVELFGRISLGAERWIVVFGIKFQPSELGKMLLFIFLATYIAKYKDRLNTFKVLVPLAALLAIPLALVFLEPDLSTTIVIFISLALILYLGGLHYKIIFSVFACALPFILVIAYLLIYHPEVKILSTQQYNRLIGFFDPDNEAADSIRYQQENALLAIGSGGLTGKGLYNDDETSVKNGNMLPECHTDFIFTIIAEELGFIGALAVIVLILLIIFECFLTGARCSEVSGRLFCYGVGSMICIQTFVNIAVNTMLLPNTGLTLPFVSYGLTSLISLCMGMGIVLNVGLHRPKKLY